VERERYRRMRAVLREVEGGHHDNPRYTHRDSTVLLVALWAALHTKPIGWATAPAHWDARLRPRGGLPSQSCMSRRLQLACGPDADPDANADDCRATIFDLLERWQAALRRQLPDSDVKLIDGRGLVVGGCSKDPDAGFGFTAGTKAKGYKLHWVVDQVGGAVDGWLVAPMNFPEPQAARHLIAHLPPHTRYVLADNNYDRGDLYERAGHDRGGVQWMAIPRRNVKGFGHRQHSDWRLRVQPWLRTDEGRRTASTARITIEQVNGRAGCATVGLNHLPYHARRLHRVTVWTALKILILTDLQAATYGRACA
jgi:hypothetical protein